MKVATAIAACVLLLAACGSTGPSTSTASSGPAATLAHPTVIPTRCPNPEIGMGQECLGPIDAGTYTTELFSPTLTYTVPAGWANLEDMPGNFLLLPPGSTLAGVNPGTSDYLGVYTSVVAPELCTGQADLGVSGTFDGLVGWLEADPAIALANEHDVTVGGLDGVVMDISMKDPRGDGCREGVWGDIYVGRNPSSLVHAVGEDYPIRVYLLHNGDRSLAIEVADARGGSDYPDWIAAATPVIESFVFGAH
jgi:hypothetical protein